MPGCHVCIIKANSAKKNGTIEWTDCKMHNPATGTQTAKEFNKLCKTAKTSNSCAPTSFSTHHSHSPPCYDSDTHSTYHIEDWHWSMKCSRWCSSLLSHDRHNDDQHSHWSSCPCVDSNYAVLHDCCPSGSPYHWDMNLLVMSVASEVLSHNDGPDHSALHTDLDTNASHPIHFDDHGK